MPAAFVAALSLHAKIRLFALPAVPLPCPFAMPFSTTFVAFIIHALAVPKLITLILIPFISSFAFIFTTITIPHVHNLYSSLKHHFARQGLIERRDMSLQREGRPMSEKLGGLSLL